MEPVALMIPVEHILTLCAAILLISILASKVAVRSGVPALLLFLALGMLAGSDGPGGLYFDYPYLAQSVGVIALAFILFSGGLDTSWRDVRVALRPGLALSTLGVIIPALSVGWFTHQVFDFTWSQGVLLGAIIASTDAAAVFAVLRGKGLHLRGRLKPLLELESGSNDPMAVFLTIGMTQLLVDPALPPTHLIPLFLLQMGLGALCGVALGKGMLIFVNRLRLEYDGLYPVLTVGLAMLAYGIPASLGGNGFLAVYIAGLMMAREDFIHKRSLIEFHDGLAWLMQIAMFLVLGLQVYPSRLPSVAATGLLIALFLIFVARPLSVFLALALTRFKLREKLFVSWVGLRGAAPIVLATFPLLAGIDKADTFFHLVFFIVLTSVLLQGTLIGPIANWLRVNSDTPPPRSPLAYVMRDGVISNDLFEVTVPETSVAVGKQIIDLHLPKGVLIVLIGRNADMLVPSGATIIEAGDKLLLVAGEAREKVREILECELEPQADG